MLFPSFIKSNNYFIPWTNSDSFKIWRMHLQVSFPATRTSIDTQLSMKTTLHTHSGHTYSHILTIYSHTAHTNSYIYTHSFIIYAYTHIYSHTLTHIFSNIHTVYTLKCTHTGNKYLYSHAHLHTYSYTHTLINIICIVLTLYQTHRHLIMLWFENYYHIHFIGP